jgi:hypothetical protein
VSFTAEEQAEIAGVFAQIRRQVNERYSLSGEQQVSTGHKLDDLLDASKGLGRKDWMTILLSAGFGMVFTDLIPTDVVQHVVGLAVRGIAHLFGVDLTPLTILA